MSDDYPLKPSAVLVLYAAFLADMGVWGAAMFQMVRLIDTGEPLWLLFALSIALHAAANAHYAHLKSR